MLRVCVIGMGPIGNRHADIYREDSLAELAGVCDLIPERADAAAARLGVPGFHDAAAMLEALRPQVVSVATGGYEYGSDHYLPTMQALERGCHVLCEKPLSNEVPRAREMVLKARERNVCLGTNLNHRFTPAAVTAKRWIAEGRVGAPLFMNMAMWIGNPAESSPYFHLKALHPHTIDIMRYYCGDIAQVQCFAIKAPGRAIWSTAQFNVKFAGGAIGHLTGSYDILRGHPMERCEVAGTQGRFVLVDMYKELTLYPHASPEKTVITNPICGGMTGFSDTFRRRLHRFLEQICADVEPDEIDGSGRDGLAAQNVIQAAIESLETGRAVTVPPLGLG
ncbi:MAG TPA: Gfo/Idh/MocA family oxidoreductase [Armatimonadota bacterium]|nr:Gfo/Idh/MocA family oxidoreductase [Armatimonadota bacterium]